MPRRAGCAREGYFYPRPPRGGRHFAEKGGTAAQAISIHALREEGDLCLIDLIHAAAGISIHALREEGDQFTTHRRRWADYISIHALREEGDKLEEVHGL